MTAPTDEQPQNVPSQGGWRGDFKTLFAVAWPLVLSNSFTTIQITIDRIFLSRLSADAASGATASVMFFWLPYILLFCTAGYVATFVAQYTGAKRHLRTGAALWQGLYFAVFAGLGFMGLYFLAPTIFKTIGHSAKVQPYEVQYFKCMVFFALPGLITAAINGFFSARGESWTVVVVSVVGTVVNAILDYGLIEGNLGLPRWEVYGAGVATVIGGWASAITGFALLARRRLMVECGTFSQWRFDPQLMWRLLRYGGPSAVHWMLDAVAFNAFVIISGYYGNIDLAATGLTITINNVAFIPMMGAGQGVSILVGQCLGRDDPRAAERLSYVGLVSAGSYMTFIAILYVLIPSVFIAPFEDTKDPAQWAAIAEKVRVILWFVAAFSIFDAVNIVFSFALRGAGDTVFVSLVSLLLAWPVMVIPTWLAQYYGWNFYWTWAFASAYVILQAICFFWRFQTGKWKSMRVIEPAVIEETGAVEEEEFQAE